MSWMQVDFSLVRYSPIEGTHFFYDDRYPSTVQFLLSGHWEAWDVGWVKYKAQDPDIRRIAEEAETRLIHDPASDYIQWPSEPPPGPPRPGAAAEADPTVDPALQVNAEEFPGLLPTPDFTHSPSASLSPRDDVPLASPALGASYDSPYGPQPAPTSHPIEVPMAASRAQVQGAPNHRTHFGGHAPRPPANAPQGPPLQPAIADPPGVILSRNRETKILLSMDGDGIRGLSMLLVVESLVNAICVKIGQRLDPHQIFDLTGGSSLGGAIAIMLCRLQMQAHRAREAYKQIARQVYLNKKDYFVSLDPHVPTPYVDGLVLENEIKAVIVEELGNEDELLFDGREDSGDVFVVSTHIEIGTNKAALMRSYQTRRITGPDLDANMTIWQAMKATSVAPRYMLPQPGINQRLVIEPGLVDHGTAKNNPVRDILYECRKLFRYANDMMIIVSVGTGEGLDREREIAEMANSVGDRNAEAKMWGDKFEIDHQPLMDRGWMKYFRFNVTGLEDVPLEEWRHENLIKEKTTAYLAQPEVSVRFYACVDAITDLLLGV